MPTVEPVFKALPGIIHKYTIPCVKLRYIRINWRF